MKNVHSINFIKHTALLACSALLAVSLAACSQPAASDAASTAGSASSSATSDTAQIPNPWTGCTTLADAAALTGTAELAFSRRAVLVLCADNGVVAQGVSQTDQSVTRAVAENLAARRTSVCQMAKTARCEVVPVDLGMAGEPVPGVQNCRIAAGTADFTTGPAITLSLIHI